MRTAPPESSFMVTKHVSVSFMKAVTSLRSLAAEEGLDVAERAAAEVSSRERRKLWTVTRRHPCIKAVEGKRCAGPCPSDHQPPASDHASIIERDGKLCYYWQPYGIHWENLQALVDYCEERGLVADVDARGAWHFPGHVLGILVYRKEDRP